LDIPEVPPNGVLKGTLELQGNGANEGQTITLSKPTGAKATATTDATGLFVFDDLAPGAYAVKIDVARFAPLTEVGTVIAGQTTDLGTLKPAFIPPDRREGAVRGKVLPPPGVGSVAGGQVELRKAGTAQPLALAALGSSGEFIVRIEAGDYALLASHPSFV